MYASPEDSALLYRLYQRDKGRIYFSSGPRSARQVVISKYTRMYNYFKGDKIRFGKHIVQFDYVPDISTPRDAYRMVYRFIWSDKDAYDIEDIQLSKFGLAIYLKKDIVILRMDGNDLQRAVIRGKEASEADMAWYQRPLS